MQPKQKVTLRRGRSRHGDDHEPVSFALIERRLRSCGSAATPLAAGPRGGRAGSGGVPRPRSPSPCRRARFPDAAVTALTQPAPPRRGGGGGLPRGSKAPGDISSARSGVVSSWPGTPSDPPAPPRRPKHPQRHERPRPLPGTSKVRHRQVLSGDRGRAHLVTSETLGLKANVIARERQWSQRGSRLSGGMKCRDGISHLPSQWP